MTKKFQWLRSYLAVNMKDFISHVSSILLFFSIFSPVCSFMQRNGNSEWFITILFQTQHNHKIPVISNILKICKMYSWISESVCVFPDGCRSLGSWSVYDHMCYTCIYHAVSWREAAASCQQLGASLVTISNSGIQAFLESAVSWNYFHSNISWKRSNWITIFEIDWLFGN